MTRKPITPDWHKQLGDAAQPDRYVAKTRVKNKDRTNITFFLAISTHRRLRELAIARNTSLQQLVAEAVDAWLAAQGEPGFKETDK